SAIAYVLVYLEIEEQLTGFGGAADYVYMSSGSKGQAGLILASKARQHRTHIAGICARPDPGRAALTATIANDAAAKLGLDLRLEAAEVDNDDRFSKERDDDLSPGCFEAISLGARHEGLMFDPVYTGRAVEGMIAHIREGRLPKHSRVVFIHTGGSPSLFAFEDALRPYLHRRP
ncbi:MAG: hypothetical protein KGJ86_12090, partial [Chloroflexota bacterium]|nr:hypothetical protein [Chloroflexota bacterium]